MKPYQILLKKRPNKWGKEGTKREDPSPTKKNKTQSGIVCTMRCRNKSCSKTLTKHEKTNKKENGM
jgi:hypothetical protein